MYVSSNFCSKCVTCVYRGNEDPVLICITTKAPKYICHSRQPFYNERS